MKTLSHWRSSLRMGSLVAIAVGFVLPSLALAGWRVVPIRLDLDARAKTGTVKVVNEGDQPVNMQVTVSHWTQDETGADVYEESEDLIYFPRILDVPAGDEQLIRAGFKAPATDAEHAYRLFITEIPNNGGRGGASVGIALRFGVPVFSAPIAPAPSGRVDDLRIEGGSLSFTVVNTGNVHFKMSRLGATGLDAKGKPLFEEGVDGWYLLRGASRAYSIPLEPVTCAQATDIKLLIEADVVKLQGKLPVDPEQCAQ